MTPTYYYTSLLIPPPGKDKQSMLAVLLMDIKTLSVYEGGGKVESIIHLLVVREEKVEEGKIKLNYPRPSTAAPPSAAIPLGDHRVGVKRG